MFKCKETCYADRLYEKGKEYSEVDARVKKFFDSPEPAPEPEPDPVEMFDLSRERTLSPEERRAERRHLTEQLDILGVEYNPKWGLKKLRACLDEHGA